MSSTTHTEPHRSLCIGDERPRVECPSIDMDYLTGFLRRLLEIPSPTGYTDEIVHFCGQELRRLGIPFELTRRGAIRADIPGQQSRPDRAIVAHVDTLGAMVKMLKPNGRLELVSIGTWSARFAEGARCTIFTDRGSYRGTILPLKASGHTFNTEIDTQPVAWDNVELRVDAVCSSEVDLVRHGFNIGDFVAIDPQPEFTGTGFINSRHLDDKAGVAVMFAAAKAVLDARVPLPVDCHLLLTISEEVGSGASAVLHQDVTEMVTIDNATPAPGQNSRESGVTVAMADSTGPFDYHLTQKLLRLCREHDIRHQRDIFRYYRCDSAAAIEAGNDIRTALVCFGVDSSHGYERTHVNALRSLAELIALYMQSEPAVERDRMGMGPLAGFPHQPVHPADSGE
ncbi:osmoprotectant NAGGN system M42 family peptidase [Azospirillum sp. RWY-5-1]|uniref:Osmoprotectant NAGGN system M42 family peptidase n=1 Tax=Azospirillum oleiclasticum TaxID=2735135 RepID=A0ABX2T546_9PROT|nr:osmoprotectant NAGGN system M42 family peptidase [Azospirillum oleiclasticum]NYZ18258.1 osmoprotectant NAGGN system M42 family peptidase [Azospirillum oleiclasticum]